MYARLQYLLSTSVVDSRGRLVDGEDEELCDVDMRRSGGGPDDLLSDVLGNHF